MTTEAADTALLDRIEGGDADALASLYDRHAARILGLTTRILGEAGEAEDVLQEVFLQVWRSPRRFDPSRGAVLTWLLVLARSRAIDRLRALRRRGRGREVPIEETPLSSSEPDLEAKVETARAGTVIRRALGELPAEQRRALELAYFGGYTQSEIADLTGAPLGTVKTRLRQGLMKLRDGYRAYSGSGDPFASP